jgi:hypothetical protein
MSLRSCRTYVTCLVALCATINFTALVVFAGIASACEGNPEPCEAAPAVTTTEATSVTYSSAYINGDVNPNGCNTTYNFEYRKSGGSWVPEPTHELTGTLSQPVWEWLPSLLPETTYEFKLTATNQKGTTPGSTKSFKTPAKPVTGSAPSVTTQSATAITDTSATLNGLVNPNGLSTTYEFKYGTKKGELKKATTTTSAGSGTKNVEVSANVTLDPETVYYFQLSASNSAGTTPGGELSLTTAAAKWQIKTTPNPGSTGTMLNDVSCEPSSSVCTAVGQSTSAGIDSPVALRWNGISWSEQTAAKKSGATHTRLYGVDCPSETRCLAVGNHESSEGPSVLSEVWNEGKWNVQTTPSPTESTTSEFSAIGCNNTAECTAVGSAMVKGVKTAIAERWKSPNWALSSIPTPEGSTSSELDGVDCLWSNFCAAVGRYTSSGGQIKNLVEFWNGTEWSIQAAADPAEAEESYLAGVSCSPTPNRCMAVGAWRKKTGPLQTLAYRFNGVTTWTLQTTPNPSGSVGSVYRDVSCPSETSCTAAGYWFESLESLKPLAAAWNGSSWSGQSTAIPTSGSLSGLFGVSCRGSSCMGVGWTLKSSGGFATLSEFRE